MMNLQGIKLVTGLSIVVLSISLVHSDIILGKCPKKCTGGPADLCLACASHCVKTCDDPTGGVCVPECKKNACQCANGFLRDSNGKCVLPSQCASPALHPVITPPRSPACPICTGGPHDHCVSCGSACPPTCGVTISACPAICKINVCQCDDGYSRAQNGQCVPTNQCHLPPPCPKCTGGPHDHCVACGSACPPTCGLAPLLCPTVCKVNVCQCDAGFSRLPPSGLCVRSDLCPK